MKTLYFIGNNPTVKDKREWLLYRNLIDANASDAKVHARFRLHF